MSFMQVRVEMTYTAAALSLTAAALEGHLERVKELLAAGADVNAAGVNFMTPLNAAGKMGHLEVVRLLLDGGANIHAAGCDGDTGLHSAAGYGRLEVVQLMLAKGADVNAANSRGETPLHAAAAYRHPKVVQLLLSNGADLQLRPRYSRQTTLDVSAWSGDKHMVQLLLEGWGQLLLKGCQIPAANLATAAKSALMNTKMPTFARLAKELRKLYPAELSQLLEQRVNFGWNLNTRTAAAALAAVLDEWASDVSSIDAQRAAVREREVAVAKEQQAQQQLIVGVAAVVRSAQQDGADSAHAAITRSPSMTGDGSSCCHQVEAVLQLLIREC